MPLLSKMVEAPLRLLGEHRIDCVIVGGIAATVHGSSLLTNDVDVCYARDPENLKRLAGALQSVHARMRNAPKGLPFILDAETLKRGLNFTFITDIGDLDLLSEVRGVGHNDEVLANSITVELFDYRFAVIDIGKLEAIQEAQNRNLMPNIKPLRKLVDRAREVREHHRERHTPSGFAFALADSVDYFDQEHWDQVTSHDSLFLSPRYLRVLEEAGPENLRQCYALVFREKEPVAAIAAQSVTVSVARLRKKAPSNGRLDRFEEKMLVCGNLLSWGMHGIAFAPNVDHAPLWTAVAEAIYRLRRVDKLFGDTAFVMVKDIPDEYASAATALSRFSYRELETEPNMILEISPHWKSYDDYLASLTSKYRKQSKQIEKEVTAAGCTVEEIDSDEIARKAEKLHALYLQTHKNARLRLVTLPVTFLPALAASLGDDMRFTVLKRDGELLGFVTTVKDGDTAVGYYIGFDRKANADLPIYFRLLQSVIGHAIALGCRRLSLGRTALEPKARLGARPDPMRIWIRHRIPMLNLIVRGLLHTIDDHEEPPERNPFK